MAARQVRSPLVALALSLLPLLPLLAVVPTLVATDPSVQSEASVSGYNNAVAYQVALAWLVVVAVVWWRRGGDVVPIPPARLDPSPLPARQRWLERLAIAGTLTLALWPWALAPRGSYLEDTIFLNAAHRLVAGLVPYRDFEFLYGPLMIVPLGPWMRLTGFSLESYFGFLLLTELAGWMAVVAFLQRVAPQTRARVWALAVIGVLLVNPALGVNYAPLRRVLPLAALLVLTFDPRRLSAPAGVVLGVALAYSHDTAMAAGVAAAALYAVLLRTEGLAYVRGPVLAFGVAAVATWSALSLLLLGPAVVDYVREARTLLARFSAGEAAFRFYWTANAVAAFALIVGGVAVVARGLASAGRGAVLAWGDRFLLVAVVATVVQLKGGLNRADVWHLCGGVLPLVVAFTVPLPRAAFQWTVAEGRALTAALLVMCATYAFGQLPLAAYVARGWLEGWRAPSPPVVTAFASAAPALEPRRLSPQPDRMALARYFAAPERQGALVYFYGTLWGLGPWVGVTHRAAINDDFLYSDERGRRVADWLDEARVPYVVMTADAEARLLGHPEGADEFARRLQPSLVKTVGAWLSSVHFTAVEIEMPLQDARWRRLVGDTLRARYARDTVIGSYVVWRRTTP